MYYGVDCWACLGERRDCEVCNGGGKLPQTVCPNCQQSPDIHRALQTYRWMQRGFLPAPGSTLEQSHTWVVAVELIERLWDHQRAKSLERARQQTHP